MLEPFEVLLDRQVSQYPMPAELERVYGRLGFGTHEVYANFVASLDGVVSLGSTPSAGSVISGRNSADRFLMGLLRACADAVVIGAGTMRATPGHHWTPSHVAPEFASDFADLRQRLGRRPEPRLVVLSASGAIDAGHVAIQRGATVVTSERMAKELAHRLPASCDVIGVGAGAEVDLALAVGELRARGYEMLLTEGGPHVMGDLMGGGLVDEIFLTISPVVAGRGDSERLGMVAGTELLPANGAWSHLVSARSHGDFLFLRYRLTPD
jgi:riboflavin biosynthesis pyrimidine reductase